MHAAVNVGVCIGDRTSSMAAMTDCRLLGSGRGIQVDELHPRANLALEDREITSGCVLDRRPWHGCALARASVCAADQYSGITTWAAFLGEARVADLIRAERVPEDAIRHHPAVRQKHIRSELHGDQLVVHLDHDALDPAADAFAIQIVVAEDLHASPTSKPLSAQAPACS